MFIIDYIGAGSLVHTHIDIRQHRPRVGDPVWIEENEKGLHCRYGVKEPEQWRIESIEGDHYRLVRSGSFHWISADMSSVSGGPFSSLAAGYRLTWSHQIKQVRFWNWGNNRAGGDMGVYYNIDRPLWNVVEESE